MSSQQTPLSSSTLLDNLEEWRDEWHDSLRERTAPQLNAGDRWIVMEDTTPVSRSSQGQMGPSSSVLRSQPRVDHRPPASRITAPSSSRKGEKKLSAVLSSEGRLAIERFQREEAEDLRLRTMARIGELYMAQQGPQSKSQINLDDENDEDRLD